MVSTCGTFLTYDDDFTMRLHLFLVVKDFEHTKIKEQEEKIQAFWALACSTHRVNDSPYFKIQDGSMEEGKAVGLSCRVCPAVHLVFRITQYLADNLEEINRVQRVLDLETALSFREDERGCFTCYRNRGLTLPLEKVHTGSPGSVPLCCRYFTNDITAWYTK